MNVNKEYDFASMTATEALDALVNLDVAKWGDNERAASRELHAAKSRGLLINSIVHHQLHDFGGVFSAETRKIAKRQLTSADKAELRKGG